MPAVRSVLFSVNVSYRSRLRNSKFSNATGDFSLAYIRCIGTLEEGWKVRLPVVVRLLSAPFYRSTNRIVTSIYHKSYTGFLVLWWRPPRPSSCWKFLFAMSSAMFDCVLCSFMIDSDILKIASVNDVKNSAAATESRRATPLKSDSPTSGNYRGSRSWTAPICWLKASFVDLVTDYSLLKFR